MTLPNLVHLALSDLILLSNESFITGHNMVYQTSIFSICPAYICEGESTRALFVKMGTEGK